MPKKKLSGQAAYMAALTATVYPLWANKITQGAFNNRMIDTVYQGLKTAWVEGAAKAGIAEDEMTDPEISAMQTDIYNQFQYITNFGVFIMAHSKDAGGKLISLAPRILMWASRYSEFFTRGYMMAKQDQKMKWNLGPTEKHCGSCVKLTGKVKRASVWLSANIYPKSPRLECKGYKCLCTLSPTDEPVSRGRLPSIP